jgi:hypothetical protein
MKILPDSLGELLYVRHQVHETVVPGAIFIIMYMVSPRLQRQEAAQPQENAQSEKQNGFHDHGNGFLVEKFPVPAGQITLWANTSAFLTGDALSILRSIWLQLYAHRALFLAGLTALQTIFRLPLQGGKGHLGQQGKQRPHGTEKLAKKAFLAGHTNQNHDKQRHADRIPAESEASRQEKRENRPGIPAADLVVTSQSA